VGKKKWRHTSASTAPFRLAFARDVGAPGTNLCHTHEKLHMSTATEREDRERERERDKER